MNGVTINVEIKNAVGSAIKAVEGNDPSVEKQGRSIGEKHIKQLKKWKDLGKIQDPNKVLTVMDLFDVPVSAKPEMQAAITGLNEGVPSTGKVKVSVIRDNGTHASTHTMSVRKFKKKMQDPEGFWVFPTRPF